MYRGSHVIAFLRMTFWLEVGIGRVGRVVRPAYGKSFRSYLWLLHDYVRSKLGLVPLRRSQILRLARFSTYLHQRELLGTLYVVPRNFFPLGEERQGQQSLNPRSGNYYRGVFFRNVNCALIRWQLLQNPKSSSL